MIFYDIRQRSTLKQCSDRMKLMFGNKALSKVTIYNWFKEFIRRHKNFRNDVREIEKEVLRLPYTFML